MVRKTVPAHWQTQIFAPSASFLPACLPLVASSASPLPPPQLPVVLSMEISTVRGLLLVSLLGALFLYSTAPCLATDHIVGANRGWQPPANAGPDAHLNYTVWAASQKFIVGDEISFHYPENIQYSVFQVNYSVYTNCTINMWSGHDWIYNWTNKGGRTVILLNESMVYYFVDASHCQEGMKVAINVTKNESEKGSSSLASKKEGSYASHAFAVTLPTLLVAQTILFMCVHMLFPTL